jgi:hypothetical protein
MIAPAYLNLTQRQIQEIYMGKRHPKKLWVRLLTVDKVLITLQPALQLAGVRFEQQLRRHFLHRLAN